MNRHLDNALDEYRRATVASAPKGFASSLALRLTEENSSFSIRRLLAYFSLGAAAASISFTLLITHREETSPPPMPEFGHQQASNLFAKP